jgi:hypothetical protein
MISGSHGGEYEDGCLLIALMTEAARTSETLVNFYQTTRRYNPEDGQLHLSIILPSTAKSPKLSLFSSGFPTKIV